MKKGGKKKGRPLALCPWWCIPCEENRETALFVGEWTGGEKKVVFPCFIVREKSGCCTVFTEEGPNSFCS